MCKYVHICAYAHAVYHLRWFSEHTDAGDSGMPEMSIDMNSMQYMMF
jgi:hypothetical protein